MAAMLTFCSKFGTVTITEALILNFIIVSNVYCHNCTHLIFFPFKVQKIGSWDEENLSISNTAALLLFLDKLFDSVNSSKKTSKDKGKMRIPVTVNSGHVEFWRNAIKL